MAENLSEYKRKRDPKKTSEPFGGTKGKAKEPIFVVQRHDASRLHYDFRLEKDGALLSWAVPKGVPLEPGEQHLAVHVEDHPLEYATFEGEIPKGQYGAGTVEIWDSGTYELLEEKKNGGLTVRLHGSKLDGTWALVPAHLSGQEKNWLILRKRDESAPAPRGTSCASVASIGAYARPLDFGAGELSSRFRTISQFFSSPLRCAGTSAQMPSSRSPCKRTVKPPFFFSSSSSYVPVSQISTLPAPYWPFGISPSNVAYSRG